jgi:hypothetical protein
MATEKVGRIVAMGFEQTKAIAALKANNDDEEIAIDWYNRLIHLLFTFLITPQPTISYHHHCHHPSIHPTIHL